MSINVDTFLKVHWNEKDNLKKHITTVIIINMNSNYS